ncbi:hypothetical protein MMC17_004011 [Xylographa soralifera]|nr:hypothetical protein [Xylographa soralifera]
MFAPGVPQVMAEFRSSDQMLESFVVSVYILGYAGGPLLLAPLSELYGRLMIFHASNLLFIAFTTGCALSSNMGMLVGFRFLSGFAGSAALSIGGGIIADLFVQEERGRAIAVASMGALLGPVVGPVAGGYLAQAKGWRWIFLVLAIAFGAGTLACFTFWHETYSVTILECKAKRLRSKTSNPHLRSALHDGLSYRAAFRRAIVRPLKMLVLSPIVLALSLFTSVIYGYLYLLFTTITEVFEVEYGFSQGTVGLTYLGVGLGMLFGLAAFGLLSDRMLKAKAKATYGEMKPEYRLPLIIPGAFLVPVGLFVYGWAAEKHVFWLVPVLGTSLVGMGTMATFMPIQAYLVDAFPTHAASALAANTVLRSLAGAVLPLAGPAMYESLGLGWGNSLLGFIAVALLPIPFLLIRYGERIRKSARWEVE